MTCLSCLSKGFLFLSVLALFGNQDGNGNRNKQPLTFLSLKDRIIGLLMSALQCETDAINTQMLLAGRLLYCYNYNNLDNVQVISSPLVHPVPLKSMT